MTGNDNVPPSLELVRISNHALKGMVEANSWKNRSKLFQPSDSNQLFQSCGMMWYKSCGITKTFRKQVCFCIILCLFQ